MTTSTQARITIHSLRQMKERGEKIAMLTAYDATFARLLDEAGADVLLVGDSLGMVVQGHDTTLPVTLEEVAYHCRAVARGARRAHIVGDMPFMTYQASFKPRFVRRYETLGARVKDAVSRYVADVRAGSFPSDAESFSIAENKASPTTIEPALYSTAKKAGER